MRSAAPARRESERYRGRRRTSRSYAAWWRLVALVAALGVLIVALFGINAAGRDRSREAAAGTNSANGQVPYSKPPGYVYPPEPADPTSTGPTSMPETPMSSVSTSLPAAAPAPPAAPTPPAPTTLAQTPQTTAPTQVVIFGWTGQLIGVGSGHCLDIPANDPFDGAPLQIAVCNTSSAQQWTFASDGTVRARGMCMDVAWGSTSNGAAIQLGTCDGGTAQIFVLNQVGEIVNQRSGKCVSVNDASADYGSQLSIWSCNGGSYQRWRR